MLILFSPRYQVMMSCWQNEPEARPAFSVLTKQLRKMENQHKVRFNMNIETDSLNKFLCVVPRYLANIARF